MKVGKSWKLVESRKVQLEKKQMVGNFAQRMELLVEELCQFLSSQARSQRKGDSGRLVLWLCATTEASPDFILRISFTNLTPLSFSIMSQKKTSPVSKPPQHTIFLQSQIQWFAINPLRPSPHSLAQFSKLKLKCYDADYSLYNKHYQHTCIITLRFVIDRWLGRLNRTNNNENNFFSCAKKEMP